MLLKYLLFELSVGLVVVLSAPRLEEQQCDSGYWNNRLKDIEALLDEDVQPCHNFYEYACGKWRAPYQLKSLGARDALTLIRAENKQILLNYFEKIEEETKMQPNETVANFFNSCFAAHNRDRVKETSLLMLAALAADAEDKWLIPQVNVSATVSGYDWLTANAQLRKYGIQCLWRCEVQTNWQNSEQQILYLTAPKFEFLKRKSSSQPQVDEDAAFLYQRYIKYLMLSLGVGISKAKLIALKVVDFERSLISISTDERLLVLQEPQSLQSLNQELYTLGLKTYIKILFNNLLLPQDYASKMLLVIDKNYLKKLATHMRTVDASTLNWYFLVQFMSHFEIQMHTDDTYNEQKAFCLQQVQNLIPKHLNDLFFKLLYGSEMKAQNYLRSTQSELQNIFSKLQQQFQIRLNTSNIFEKDASARALVLEKLNAMRLLLPHLEQQTDGSNQKATPSTYELSLLKYSQERSDFYLKQVLHSLDQNESSFSSRYSHTYYGPLHVNAYYRLKKNAIELPIGLLRAPFYNKCLKQSSIYGSLVYMMGHELMHGFDYDGLNYDKLGNLAGGNNTSNNQSDTDDRSNSSSSNEYIENTSLNTAESKDNFSSWNAKSLIKFGTSASCYFYERYSNPARNINENIADTEGLRLALHTLKAAHRNENDVIALSDEDMKIFFISFAQTWCGSNTDKDTNIHANHKERVNNVLGNIDEFAETFKCKTGSRMMPEKKCRIW